MAKSELKLCTHLAAHCPHGKGERHKKTYKYELTEVDFVSFTLALAEREMRLPAQPPGAVGQFTQDSSAPPCKDQFDPWATVHPVAECVQSDLRKQNPELPHPHISPLGGRLSWPQSRRPKPLESTCCTLHDAARWSPHCMRWWFPPM